MKIAVFSTKTYDRHFLEKVNVNYNHELVFFKPNLDENTAILAMGFIAVCVFVNDQLNRETLEILAQGGTRLIALRCAGYNNVDLTAVSQLQITVVRVPAYSPYAVAEHAMALIYDIKIMALLKFRGVSYETSSTEVEFVPKTKFLFVTLV